MLIVHIIAGIVSLLAGTAILVLKKGDSVHRKIGTAFVAAMLTAALSSFYLYFQIRELPLMGFLCAYLTVTSWITVKREPNTTTRWDVLLMILIAAASVGLFVHGFNIEKAADESEPVPAAVFYIFGALSFLCAALDLNMILRGGLGGMSRIARHLWRMLVAMLIATMSFLGQDIYPDWIYETNVIFLPLLLLLLLLVYWLARVRGLTPYELDPRSSRRKKPATNENEALRARLGI